ncbi:RNA polymerase II elongation factor ELL isoform X3 [Physeter macrocephalus]|uniref:RNA polymerase II elongation factor ELL isoform X3 n=1 Tax=Physeter macrocephalus TaxID=9755 RepID=A0A455AT92_PHYMC|nr:RNA polymerase II elongation factor ELL isoform X3 [Physeter catodon]|eukprot:XP_028339344.1 RNA polymerase II elongation factor ELL isoform X3 [Physeter catodon]
MQHVGGGCGGDCGSRWIRRGRGQSRLMNNAARQRAAGWGVAGAPLALEPGRGGRGSDGRKMAALKEARSYGLSCGRVSDCSKVSVFHVKLTDSALRAFESYRASQDSVSLRPSIRFQGSQGHISIPQPDCPTEPRTFSFYLSNIGRDSPQGSFDCIQQYVSSHGDVHLDCLGSIQDKITVCATDDSYQKARQSLAQAEEETRSRGAIVIKPGGRYLGKKVQFRKPAPGAVDAVPSRKRATPVNLASAIKKTSTGSVSGGSGVSQRPFRDRVLHLLALRPYRKAELLLRLQKDGLAQADKDALDGLLQQVANVNAKDGTCTLKDCVYKDVQKDWPGYSDGDQKLLKRMLIRKLCQPQSSGGLPGDLAANSPPGEHGSSASPPQKRPQPPDFIDPLANKKPRISHFTQRAQPAVNGKLSVPHGREALLPTPGPPAGTDTHLPLRLEPPRAHDPLADVSNDLGHSGRDCERGEVAAPAPTECLSLPLLTDCAQPSRPHGSSLHGKSKKKSKKHKDKERVAEDRHRPRPPDQMPGPLGAPPVAPGLNGTCSSSSVPTSTSETPDYLLLLVGRFYRNIEKSRRPTPTTARRSTAASTCTASWPTSRGSSLSTTSGSCRPGLSPRPQGRRPHPASQASSPHRADRYRWWGSWGRGGAEDEEKRDLFEKINVRKMHSSEPGTPAFRGVPAALAPTGHTDPGGVSSSPGAPHTS